MHPTDSANSRPGYARLIRQSYRLGFRWLFTGARRGWPAKKVALQRLLVPLDPWRFYEMGMLADKRYEGSWLDVSGPKLLISLLHREGNGNWTGTDLFSEEIAAWSVLDPALRLEVEDATAMSYADDLFDGAISVSVLEHIGPGKDLAALKEIHRVVRSGGTLELTTMVGAEARDVFVDHKIYGEASEAADDRGVFFEHVYEPGELNALVEEAGWTIAESEYAVHTRADIQERFYKLAPWSYLFGGLLRIWFPRTIKIAKDATAVSELGPTEAGVAYLRLIKN
jgi:SAM-dependent methyltransferase